MNGYTNLSSGCEVRFEVTPMYNFDVVHLPVVSTHGFKSGDYVIVRQGFFDYARLRVTAVTTTTLSTTPLATSYGGNRETQDSLWFYTGATVSLMCTTRELITGFTLSGTLKSAEASEILRYPYLPEAWTGVSHNGLLTTRERVDVKTFTQNITIEWEPVLQDTIIEESFAQMDYEFFHSLWKFYMERVHLIYCPRDLSQEEYEVELLEIKTGKQHHFWVDRVTTRFKIHKILRRPYNINLNLINKKIFPSGDYSV